MHGGMGIAFLPSHHPSPRMSIMHDEDVPTVKPTADSPTVIRDPRDHNVTTMYGNPNIQQGGWVGAGGHGRVDVSTDADVGVGAAGDDGGQSGEGFLCCHLWEPVWDFSATK